VINDVFNRQMGEVKGSSKTGSIQHLPIHTLRVQPSKASLSAPATGPDPRLPAPGTIMRRVFKGRNLDVKVLDDGFEFEGRRYQSLIAVASEVAGSRWNGQNETFRALTPNDSERFDSPL
jgi:Protein of unknown function (DUF2924)